MLRVVFYTLARGHDEIRPEQHDGGNRLGEDRLELLIQLQPLNRLARGLARVEEGARRVVVPVPEIRALRSLVVVAI
jgi:hypothetical protein